MGGYHAKTRKNCTIITIISYCLYLVIVLTLPVKYNLILGIAAILFYCIIAIILTPVQHKNNPITKEKANNNRKKILLLSTLYITCFISLNSDINYMQYALAFSLSLFIVGIMAMIGRIFRD